MKYSQQMFKYGDGKYRFISHEPLVAGETVYLIGRSIPYTIMSVLEVRDDKGKWKEKTLSNIIKVKDD